MRVIFCFFLIFILTQTGQSQLPYPSDVFKMQAIWAESENALRITYSSNSEGLVLRKKVAESDSEFENILTLDASGGEYLDSDIEEGIIYAYEAFSADTILRLAEFGYKIPLEENRGWYVILLDDSISSGIQPLLSTFRWNLISDGYRVKVIEVNRNQTPDEIRELLQDIDLNLPQGIRQVLLLGHVPVPYSGEEGFDIHIDHDGCWATDTYYADLDGEWEDEITVDYPDRDANKNFPGDRKFDHDTMPSAADIEVGRVDMYDLPVFGLSDTEMINRYLSKNNLFKSGNLTILGRGLECRDSIYDFAEAAAANMGTIVGTAGLFIGPYSSLRTQPKLLSAGYGSSYYDICGGVVSSQGYTTGNWFTVFTSLIGSYLQDFDFTNSVIRSSLFSNGIIISCTSGTENIQYMGLGKSIGNCNKRTQKLHGYISANLHGDPSLRKNYPIMPNR